jgi:hypothetical protein
VAAFLKSLRATGSQAKVHFFTCRVSAKSLKKLHDAGVTTHPFSYLSIRRRQPLIYLWPIWKPMLARRDFAGKKKLVKKVLHLMAMRFALYHDFLQDKTDQFGQVFLTDCRDVYFQRDPFAQNLGPGLHCFLEAGSQTIGTNAANSRMIRHAFGPETVAELAAAPVSCAGTTLGDAKDILHYLELLLETVCRSVTMDPGNDQGVHNYLIQKGLLPSVHVHDNYSSAVFTAGCEGAPSILLNGKNEVVRADGGVYAVLHQLDRHREIYRQLLAKLDAL